MFYDFGTLNGKENTTLNDKTKDHNYESPIKGQTDVIDYEKSLLTCKKNSGAFTSHGKRSSLGNYSNSSVERSTINCSSNQTIRLNRIRQGTLGEKVPHMKEAMNTFYNNTQNNDNCSVIPAGVVAIQRPVTRVEPRFKTFIFPKKDAKASLAKGSKQEKSLINA